MREVIAYLEEGLSKETQNSVAAGAVADPGRLQSAISLHIVYSTAQPTVSSSHPIVLDAWL